MTFPNLGKTFRAVADEGHAGFYKGRIAQAIVDLVQAGGGVMTLEDLAGQEAQVVEPISYEFKKGAPGADGVTLWEVCPVDFFPDVFAHNFASGSVHPTAKVSPL
jgi:gamma-glutamyltranspeptidase/glutathione hydrolase